MIYEFLISEVNADLIELKPKTEEAKRNDQNWLYKHLVRCPVIIQKFLDQNPTYWCFVPVPKDRALRASTYAQSSRLLPNEQIYQ